jgi:hypothetical protein
MLRFRFVISASWVTLLIFSPPHMREHSAGILKRVEPFYQLADASLSGIETFVLCVAACAVPFLIARFSPASNEKLGWVDVAKSLALLVACLAVVHLARLSYNKMRMELVFDTLPHVTQSAVAAALALFPIGALWTCAFGYTFYVVVYSVCVMGSAIFDLFFAGTSKPQSPYVDTPSMVIREDPR